IPRATPRHRGAAGTSERAPIAARAGAGTRTTTIAALGAAAADRAGGSAIPRAPPRDRGAAGRGEALPACRAAAAPRTMATIAAVAAAVAATAAGSAIRKDIPRPHAGAGRIADRTPVHMKNAPEILRGVSI